MPADSNQTLAKSPRLDAGLIPGEDNHSAHDIAQMDDAISDRLEYAVHRVGLTPRVKALMAALKRARDLGPLKFSGLAPERLLDFVVKGSPMTVYAPQPVLKPAPIPMHPAPRFAKGRCR